MRSVLIASAVLWASIAKAGWEGFPLADNTNTYTWSWAKDEYNPIGQIYSAIVERCAAAGINNPSNVATWPCYAGFYTNYTTNAGYVYTNIILLTTNITVDSSMLAPFAYGWTNVSGSGTSTGYPYLTRTLAVAIDGWIDNLIPHFVCTNAATNGTYTNYFAQVVGTNRPTDFPMESKAGLFSRNGIGFTTNLTTNTWGWVNGGDAYYTRQPPIRRNWLLAERHYVGPTWTFIQIGSLDTRLYNPDMRPIIRWTPGGTNQWVTKNVRIWGLQLDWPAQTTSATNEIISMDQTQEVCSVRWHTVTNITTQIGTWKNVGDVFAVMWTNALPLYGDWPYVFFAEDIDERMRVLDCLRWTRDSEPYGTTNFIGERGNYCATIQCAYTSQIALWGPFCLGGGGSYGVAAHAITEYNVLDGTNYFDFWGYRSVPQKWSLTGISTSVEHSAQFYMLMESNSWGWVYWPGWTCLLADVDGISEETVVDANRYYLIDSSFSQSNTSSRTVQKTPDSCLINPVTNYWPSAPGVEIFTSTNQHRIWGCEASDALWLFKWDFTYSNP